MVAFAMNFRIGHHVNYQTMRAIPQYQKQYALYALIFEMNRYYLDEKKYKYVTDGARSISEHSNIQPFLEEKFKFRKAYCKMNLVYKPWFGMVVKILFPFRKFINNRKVAMILNQEAMYKNIK